MKIPDYRKADSQVFIKKIAPYRLLDKVKFGGSVPFSLNIFAPCLQRGAEIAHKRLSMNACWSDSRCAANELWGSRFLRPV